jgi:hypothetical protein
MLGASTCMQNRLLCVIIAMRQLIPCQPGNGRKQKAGYFLVFHLTDVLLPCAVLHTQPCPVQPV